MPHFTQQYLNIFSVVSCWFLVVCRSQSGLQIKSTLYQSVRFLFLLPTLLGFVCSCFQDFLFSSHSFSKQRRSTAVKIANIHIQQKFVRSPAVQIRCHWKCAIVYGLFTQTRVQRRKNQNVWLFIVFLYRWVKFAVTAYLRTQNRSA